ncbi:MAG: hypothetical protein WBA57_17065 [Elainellaceae cyanobacterium]
MRGRLAARQKSFTPSPDGNYGDRHTFSTAHPGSTNLGSSHPGSTNLGSTNLDQGVSAEII